MNRESDPPSLPSPIEGSSGVSVESTPSETTSLDPRSQANTARARRKPLWREYAEAILIAMVLALFIRVFVVQAFKIPSGSMMPTLLIGDHILVSKLAYGIQWPGDCRYKLALPPITCYTTRYLVTFSRPQRGDVIVFRYPEDEDKDFIKRIVGIPGDVVQIRNKTVYVNGVPVPDQEYTQRVDPGIIDGSINPRDNFGPVTVPEHAYFVMGDNRDQSLDSRFWGFVREDKIKGRALRIYWSWSGQGPWWEWVRWERIGKAIR
jgi:signal peptidase I